MTQQNITILGLMSGTSLDGVDMAMCNFTKVNNLWKYSVVAADTIPYGNNWNQVLKLAPTLSSYKFIKLHNLYGAYLGDLANLFIETTKIKPDYISSHGHTIFHNPSENVTFQLGNGACIAATSNITTICDFRTLDVALQGQGAPLVPIGDKLLFPEFDYCLNLGGFANISFDKDGSRIAFDISPANMALNYIVAREGLSFDDKGNIAASGAIINGLLERLNNLSFYSKEAPKSLGREWFENQMAPIIREYEHFSTADLLNTLCEHIATQICLQIKSNPNNKMIITGGGTHNDYLIRRIKELSTIEIIKPDKTTIDFKEAIIFAFLGLLRVNEENNCLSSVTGAKRNNCGGAIYFGK